MIGIVGIQDLGLFSSRRVYQTRRSELGLLPEIEWLKNRLFWRFLTVCRSPRSEHNRAGDDDGQGKFHASTSKLRRQGPITCRACLRHLGSPSTNVPPALSMLHTSPRSKQRSERRPSTVGRM